METTATRRDQLLGVVILVTALALLLVGSLVGDAPVPVTEWPIS